MITQFILKPIVDLVLAREPLEDLNNHLWRTQMALTNVMGQTSDLQFWRHNGVAKLPDQQTLILESMFLTMEYFV